MKVLFISSRSVHGRSNGGELCTNRNYLSFVEIVGESHITVINLFEDLSSGFVNAIKKRINFFFGFHEGLSRRKLKSILEISDEFSVVFIDTSIYGLIGRHLKVNGYKGLVIQFFHNVEYKIKLEKAQQRKENYIEAIVVKKNEKLACKYADRLVFLNERDKEQLKQYTVNKVVEIIPISLFDDYRKGVQESLIMSSKSIALFTGNNWYANIHGIKWFIKNVLDYVDIRLQVTGKDMDKVSSSLLHPKVDFLGFVDDIQTVIESADFIIIPIFYGSGMKVKTCEALMHGKHIIGTREAFEGYELDKSLVGSECNSANDFIDAINTIIHQKQNKFNSYNRNIFLQKYSFESTLKQFDKLLVEL